MRKTCLNCKWSRERGPHIGCFFNYQFRIWVPRKKAVLIPVCQNDPSLKSQGAKWEAEEDV